VEPTGNKGSKFLRNKEPGLEREKREKSRRARERDNISPEIDKGNFKRKVRPPKRIRTADVRKKESDPPANRGRLCGGKLENPGGKHWEK